MLRCTWSVQEVRRLAGWKELAYWISPRCEVTRERYSFSCMVREYRQCRPDKPKHPSVEVDAPRAKTPVGAKSVRHDTHREPSLDMCRLIESWRHGAAAKVGAGANRGQAALQWVFGGACLRKATLRWLSGRSLELAAGLMCRSPRPDDFRLTRDRSYVTRNRLLSLPVPCAQLRRCVRTRETREGTAQELVT